MASFKDTADRTWELRVTVESIRRVRSLVRLDGRPVELLDLLDPGRDLLLRVCSDPVLAADIGYAIAKPQADLARVTIDAFSEAIDGDGAGELAASIVEAVVGFARTPELRRALGSLPTAIRTVLAETAVIQAATADPSQTALMLRKARGAASSGSPPPSEGSASDAPR